MPTVELQPDVKKIEKLIFQKTGKKGKENPYFLVTNLLAETGELADEIIGLEGERIEDPEYNSREKVGKEIVDIVFNAVRIASHYELDFRELWVERLKELEEKFST